MHFQQNKIALLSNHSYLQVFIWSLSMIFYITYGHLLLMLVEFMTKIRNDYLFEGFNQRKFTSLELLCAVIFFGKEWQSIDMETAQLSKFNCSQIISYVFTTFDVQTDTLSDRILKNVFSNWLLCEFHSMTHIHY